jgi:hypothetical protein
VNAIVIKEIKGDLVNQNYASELKIDCIGGEVIWVKLITRVILNGFKFAMSHGEAD